MPSAYETVTIAQIAELTGINKAVVAGWRDGGLIKAVGFDKGGCRRHLFRWGDIQKKLADYTPGRNDTTVGAERCPPGFLPLLEVCRVYQIDRTTIHKRINDGTFRAAKVPMNGMGKRHYTYVARESIEQYLAKRRVAGDKPAAAILEPLEATNPLLHHRDSVCLHARRELLEKRGIKVKIPVASARK